MLKQIKCFLDLNQLNNKTIYVAVSGGIDSMTLTQSLHLLNIKHTILHCNFKLRGAESDADEEFVLDYAHKNKINIKTKSFNTKLYCQQNHLTVQEGARELRYNWFKTFLDNNNSVLLTAHHLDDQIETFFINLLRGTGLKGLTGIPNNKNKIYRPLLNFSKSQIIDFAKQKHIKFREDQSNQSDNYLRNRLRHHLVPELKQETTNLEAKFKHLFTELTEINNYLDQQINDLKSDLNQNQFIDIFSLKTLPNFLLVRLFDTYNLNRKKVNEFKKLLDSQTGSVFYTSSHTFLKDRTSIFIKPNNSTPPLKEVLINTFKFSFKINHYHFKTTLISPKNNYNFKPNCAFLDADKIKLPITARPWRKGDKIQPLGMKGKRLISDILKDKKINRFNKANQLVFECNNEIVWLVDIVVNDNFAITNTTNQVLFIEHIQ